MRQSSRHWGQGSEQNKSVFKSPIPNRRYGMSDGELWGKVGEEEGYQGLQNAGVGMFVSKSGGQQGFPEKLKEGRKDHGAVWGYKEMVPGMLEEQK